MVDKSFQIARLPKYLKRKGVVVVFSWIGFKETKFNWFWANYNIKSYEIFCDCLSQNKPWCPGVLEVKTTCNRIDIYNFAGKEKILVQLTFHGFEIDFF